MKRRAFLVGSVGVLIGAPLAARFFLQGRPDDAHLFTANLTKYRKLLDVPVDGLDSIPSASLALAPPVDAEWKYVFFSPTFFPKELSRATDQEPDSFLIREGSLFSGKTGNGKHLIGGGDTLSQICSPIGTEDRPLHLVRLLCENGRLRQAKAKGETAQAAPDLQLRHLLALENVPQKELNPGLRWRSVSGRVKPYEGFSTNYEVAGFAEIAGRRTVDVEFSATIANMTATELVASSQNGKAPTVANTHRGHAWYDLETGLLVRQELEMECSMSGIAGYKGTDGSESVTVKTQSILQLFPA